MFTLEKKIIHLNDLENNGNFSIPLFDSIPNAQYKNLKQSEENERTEKLKHCTKIYQKQMS